MSVTPRALRRRVAKVWQRRLRDFDISIWPLPHAGSNELMPDVSSRDFGVDMARPERRYDVASVRGPAGPSLVSNRRCIGGRGGQESWIRRQGGNAGHENGWLCFGPRRAHFMRWRWEYRGVGIAVTLSKPTAHADGVPADPHDVGYAPGDSQSDAEGTESRTLIEPAIRGADRPRTDTRSRTDSDAIGDEESLAVTDPVETTTTQTVTAAPSPSTVTRSVTISASPSASPSPSSSAAGEPAETERRFLALVGAGRFIACCRDSDAPSRAGTPSTSLEGGFCNGRARGGVVCPRARP